MNKETNEQNELKETKDLNKITKFRIFKSKESEEVITGVILNADSESIKQEEYTKQKDTKGRELVKGTRIVGNLEVLLDKTNYDILEKRSWENFNQDISEGLSATHMFNLIETNGKSYKVKI